MRGGAAGAQGWPVAALLALLVLMALALMAAAPAGPDPAYLQEDTPFPTVTGTPEGPKILVPDQVNVRMCPDVTCDLVGVLIAGQEAYAVGRSPGGEWIQILYPGVPGNLAWVYAAYVVLEAGPALLPIVEPPPTPTPRVTPTIDPTLAAQFNLGELPPTRLPTFTPPPPLVEPTFAPQDTAHTRSFPPVIAIIGLLVLGSFGLMLSVLRGG